MVDLARLDLSVGYTNVDAAGRSLGGFTSAARRAEQGAAGFSRGGDELAKTGARIDSSFRSAVRSIAPLIATLATVQGVRQGIGILSGFESGLVGIAKTANITDDQLQPLEERFERFGTKLSTPIEQLFEIGQVAGQLGVRGAANIAKFSDTIAKLADAAPSLRGNLEGTALSIARLLAITREDASTSDVLASVIVRLGNEFETLESHVVATGEEVAKAGAVFGITSAQAVGLAAAFDRIGTEAELSRSAVTQVFAIIDKAVAEASPKLDAFASIAGTTAGEFARVFEEDAVEALRLFLVGLGEMEKQGESTNLALAGLGLTSIRTVPTLQALAVNSDKLSQILATVEDELSNTTALEREFARGADTLRASLGRLSNTGKILVDNVLDDRTGIGAGFRSMVETGTDAIRILAGLETSSDQARVELTGLSVALSTFVGGRAAVESLRDTSDAINDAQTSAERLASGARALGTVLSAVAASKVAGFFADFRRGEISALASTTALAGGVGILAGAFFGLEDGLKVAAGLAVALRLGPVADDAVRAAGSWITFQRALSSGREVVAGSAADLNRQALGARDAAAAAISGTEATLANVRAQRAAIPVALATAEATAATTIQERARAALIAQQRGLEAQLVVQRQALAVANGQVAATSAAAAASTTLLGRATAFAAASVRGLTTAIKANPIGFILVGLSIAIPLLDNFSDELDDASDATDRLDAASRALGGTLDAIAKARAEQAVAARKQDSERNIAAIEREVAALRELQVDVEGLRADRASVTVADLVRIDPGDAVSADEAEALRKAVRDRIADALAGGVAAGSRDANEKLGEQLAPKGLGGELRSVQPLIEAIRAAGEQGIDGISAGDVADVFNFEALTESRGKFSEEFEALSVLIRASLEDLVVTDEERERISRSYANLIDPAIVGVGVEETLATIDEKLADATKRLDEARAAPPSAKRPTGGNAEAEQELAAVEERIRFEVQLAGLAEQEASIQRRLADAREAAAKAGIPEEEAEARLQVIAGLLREADAAKAARDARDELTKSQGESRRELEEFVAGLEREARFSGLSRERIEEEEAAIEARNLAVAAGIDGQGEFAQQREAELSVLEQIVDAVRREVRARQEGEAAQQRETDAKQRHIQLTEEEIRAVGSLGQELIDLSDELASATTEQDNASAGTERLGVSIRRFRERTLEAVEAARLQRDAAVEVSKSDDERTSATAAFEGALAAANAGVVEFTSNLTALAAVREVGELRDQVLDLDQAFEEIFLTDRELGIKRALDETTESAARLRDILSLRLESGIIDRATFDDASRALDEFVASSKDRLEDLADVARIRDAAGEISDSFGRALSDVALGTRSARDAAVALVQDISRSILNAVAIEPLTQRLTAGLTKVGADALGVDATAATASAALVEASGAAGLALGEGGATAGLSMTQAGTAAGSSLAAGGLSAGEAMVAAATQAAGILRTATATGGAPPLAGVFGAAGSGAGAATGSLPSGFGSSFAGSPLATLAHGGVVSRGRIEVSALARGGAFPASLGVDRSRRGSGSPRIGGSEVVRLVAAASGGAGRGASAGGGLPGGTGFRGGRTLDRGLSATIAASARSGSGVSAFQSGAIIDRPTILPQALIGEGHRAEAVVPLESGVGGGYSILAEIETGGGVRSTTVPLRRLGDGTLGTRFSARDLIREVGEVRPLRMGGIFGGRGGEVFSGSSPAFGSDPNAPVIGAAATGQAGGPGGGGPTFNFNSRFEVNVSGGTAETRRGVGRAVRQEVADARRLLAGGS